MELKLEVTIHVDESHLNYVDRLDAYEYDMNLQAKYAFMAGLSNGSKQNISKSPYLANVMK